MIKILQKFKDILNSSQPQTKTVFRYVDYNELKRIENADVENLGTYFHRRSTSNSHRYNENEKYLHFFDSANIPTHVYKSLSKGKNYVCSFEIEKSILNAHKGTGYYPPQGYDSYTYIKEYAIPVSKYNPEWFIKAEHINENSQEDYPLTLSSSQTQFTEEKPFQERLTEEELSDERFLGELPNKENPAENLSTNTAITQTLSGDQHSLNIFKDTSKVNIQPAVNEEMFK